MGGQPVLRLLLKAKEELRDFLLGASSGGLMLEQGLRELVAERYGGTISVEVESEPGVRSDLLLQQLEGPAMPEKLQREGGGCARTLLSPAPTRLLQGPADVVALSLQTEITRTLWRHRESGYLVDQPDGQEGWSAEQKRWFAAQFVPTGLLSAAEFQENYIRLIRVIKADAGAHVLVVNCSSLDPDDDVCNYHGREDTLALRTHRFNLALMEISAREGISIIDVERLISELGGQQHVFRGMQYSKSACEEICGEFLRVLADIGFFEKRPLIAQVGRGGK
jgi:hypothetical protein